MRKALLQTAFWVLFFLAWERLVYFYIDNPVNRFLFTAFDVGLMAACFYILFQWITPQFFFRRNKWYFWGGFLLTICLMSALLAWVMLVFLHRQVVPIHFDFHWTYHDMIQNRLLLALLGGAAGIIAQLATEWLRARHKIEKTQREQIASELTYLKAQVNPHFLFNAFNTIYVQMDVSPASAKESLAIFSDMLRYQLYECNAEWVPLQKEIAYLQHYIQLQQLRKDERYQIDLSFPEVPAQETIAPFLLIPFIENMFKHVSGYRQPNIIKGYLQWQPGKLLFYGMNTKDTENAILPAKGGIGLANVKRRLNLLYPQKHRLNIHNNHSSYEVWLEIQLR